MIDHRGQGSIVVIIAAALILIPIIVLVFPIAFEMMRATDMSAWGPGAEAVWTILPNVLILTMFGFITAVIIQRS